MKNDSETYIILPGYKYSILNFENDFVNVSSRMNYRYTRYLRSVLTCGIDLKDVRDYSLKAIVFSGTFRKL